MLKKIRSLTYQYAIPAAFIIFVIIDILLLGLGQLLDRYRRSCRIDVPVHR